MKSFLQHKPKQLEYVGQRKKTDCGIACVAMLSFKTYDEVAEVFSLLAKNTRGGLYPEDVFEVLDELKCTSKGTHKLPSRGAALVTIQWKIGGLSGHYVVWDGKRGQFLDPKFGLINKRNMMKHAEIEGIWTVKNPQK